MANKEEKIAAPTSEDLGNSFDREDRVLNYKPKIEYEEPEQIPEERPIPESKTELAQLRNRTSDLVAGYQSVKGLVALAKTRIDNRVAAGGGMEVKLDAKVDAVAIEALKRCFPDAPDHTKITYEQYKICLTKMSKIGQLTPQVSQVDVDLAKQNPLLTEFGGLANQAGENRSEISSPAGNIKPVDTQKLQTAGTLALFKKMYPLIKRELEAEIRQHEATKKHG